MASYQTYGDASTEANVVRSNTQSSTTTSEITSTTDSTSFQSSTTGATTTSYQILSSSTSYAPQASQTTHTTVIDYKYERLSNRTGNVTLDTLGWDTVANAPFGNLCDDGNCLETCQNYTQVFRSTYDIKQESNITLFGICTNLGTIYGDMYQANSSVLQSVSSYFPLGDQSQGVVNQVAADLSSCLAGSCDASRDPQHCNTSCSLSVLNYGNTTINMNAVSLCINDLCKDTYGLPYADQDVYGIGVS
ncbi:hypothetical protein N7454_006003 [Penicillium verhagenii]|nr:hypothetical protein N7454_006003 [Penicillium verhagenii]